MPKGANLSAETRAKGHNKMRARALAADHALLAELANAGDVAALALQLGISARAAQLRVNRAKRRTVAVVDGLGVPTTKLVTGRHRKFRYLDDELLDALIWFRVKTGRWPSRQDWFEAELLPDVSTFYARFGRWDDVIGCAQRRYAEVSGKRWPRLVKRPAASGRVARAAGTRG